MTVTHAPALAPANPAIRRRAKVAAARLRAKGRLITSRHIDAGHGIAFLGRLPVLGVQGHLSLGDRTRLVSNCVRVRLNVAPGAELTIGDDGFLNHGAAIHAERSVRIGENSRIGEFVMISDTDYHEVTEGTGVRVAPIEIGDNVWIGRHALVLPGVTIGDHAVIGAGAVVADDVPANSVVAGVPARVVRDLPNGGHWRRA